METRETTTRDGCPTCNGSGVHRDGRFFFYSVSLLACANIMFFEWPPTPGLFQLLGQICWSVGLPEWIGSLFVWLLTAVPAVFGIAFFYMWLRQDACPSCRGRTKPQMSRQTLDAIAGK